MRNAMSQDAGLGRGTESPYLDILNHLGFQFDENAPMGVSDEEMRIIGSDSTIRRLEKNGQPWKPSCRSSMESPPTPQVPTEGCAS